MVIQTWIAYCTTCNKQIEAAPNGAYIEAAAKYYKSNNPDHKVIMGYEITPGMTEK